MFPQDKSEKATDGEPNCLLQREDTFVVNHLSNKQQEQRLLRTSLLSMSEGECGVNTTQTIFSLMAFFGSKHQLQPFDLVLFPKLENNFQDQALTSEDRCSFDAHGSSVTSESHEHRNEESKVKKKKNARHLVWWSKATCTWDCVVQQRVDIVFFQNSHLGLCGLAKCRHSLLSKLASRVDDLEQVGHADKDELESLQFAELGKTGSSHGDHSFFGGTDGEHGGGAQDSQAGKEEGTILPLPEKGQRV